LGIILRVLILRLEVSVYNVYITNHFCPGGGGGWGLNPSVEVTRRKTCKTFVPITSKK
jgi:hypothetical protein